MRKLNHKHNQTIQEGEKRDAALPSTLEVTTSALQLEGLLRAVKLLQSAESILPGLEPERKKLEKSLTETKAASDAEICAVAHLTLGEVEKCKDDAAKARKEHDELYTDVVKVQKTETDDDKAYHNKWADSLNALTDLKRVCTRIEAFNTMVADMEKCSS